MQLQVQFICSLFLLFFSQPFIIAQNFVMDGTDINSCSGYFLDSGGNINDYSPNENFTTTICPEGSGDSTHIRLVFSGTALGMNDNLCFYDGPDVTAPLLACASDFQSGAPFIIQASAVNVQGCITVVFTADGNEEGAGWNAEIQCVPRCQLMEAVLSNSIPAVDPIDTGWIDVCLGEPINLSGTGNYPQNNTFYEQSDANTAFVWNFGDGGSALGADVTHRYLEAGGYIIQLTLIDSLGCTNTNVIQQRVRVAPRPDFELGQGIPSNNCLGDTISLFANVGSIDSTSALYVLEKESSFQASAIRADSLPLPDGNGASYSTSVTFTDFAIGQSLQDISDLEKICVNIEHSWMRDLEISLQCPSGQEVLLHNHIGKVGDEVKLGIPVDNDDVIIPGVGFEYCWTPNASNGSWLETAANNTAFTLPAGDYSSAEPLEQLLGCPLNGEWTIRVQDLWPDDNGIIFSWEIGFQEDLYPEIETFLPDILSFGWQDDPQIVERSPNTIKALPNSAGTNSFIFSVTDEFNCTYDTNLIINVLPITNLQCIENFNDFLASDTLICAGDSILLDLDINLPDSSDISFQTFPNEPIGAATYPHDNPYRSSLFVENIFPATLTNPTQQINSICINLRTDWAEDIRLFLETPSGQRLELSTENGRGEDDYLNTCFSPIAMDSIVNGSPPFSGSFQPEGDWNDLIGADLNGEWVLIVSDGFGTEEVGSLDDWSINLNTFNQINYQWDNAMGISCTDCPNPTLKPTSTTTYRLRISDQFGFSIQDSITVNLVDDFVAPPLSCGSSGDGEVTFFWSLPNGVTQPSFNINYQVNDDPSVNLSNFSDTLFQVDQLMEGDSVFLQLEISNAANGTVCFTQTVQDTCAYAICDLQAEIVDFLAPGCNNDQSGSITVSANGGFGNYKFLNNLTSISGDTVTFSNLGSGTYFIMVEDDRSCVDTITFDLQEPDALQVGLALNTQISCNQANDGSLIANATGGSGQYLYSWSHQNDLNSDIVSDLAPGFYTVSVTDEQNCTSTDTITIFEPNVLTIDASPISPQCFDGNDGIISTSVSGGTPQYSFVWNTGSRADTLRNIARGTYSFTVTDANGCQDSLSLNLVSPPRLRVDSFQNVATSCFLGKDGSSTVFVSGGTAPYDYLWNDSNGQLDSIANRIESGNYTVIITDLNGCQLTGDTFVPQPDSLAATFDVTNVSCLEDQDGSITANITGGTAPYEYNWFNERTTQTITDLTTGRYALTVTDNNGCEITNRVSIEEPIDNVTAFIEQTVVGCFGEQKSEARAMGIGGNGAPYSYAWSDGQTGSTADNLDSIQYFVTVTDQRGCTAIDSLKMSELEVINPNIIVSPPSCQGFENGALAINFITGGTGSQINDYNIVWSTGQSGSLIEGLLGGVMYEVTVTDPIGCSAVETRRLPDPSPITYEFEVNDVNCFAERNGSIRLFNINGGDDINSYLFKWDVAANGQTTSTAENLTAGNYSFTITDESNCMTSSTIAVDQPTPIFISFETKDAYCFGDNEGAVEASVRGGIESYQYLWSNGDTVPVLQNLNAGQYELSVTDANGCLRVQSATINQPDRFNLSLDIKDPTCFGDANGSISIDVNGGSPPYEYSLDNRQYQLSNTFLGLKADQYKIFIRDNQDCLLFEDFDLEDPEELEVRIMSDSNRIKLGDSIQLSAFIVSESENIDFLWVAPYGGTLSCDTCENVIASPTYTITYELLGTDSAGCTANDFFTLLVDQPKVILVPTAFTPNNDNNNDRLLVHGSNETIIKTFQVYDRTGSLIFENFDFMANDEISGWDGFFQSKAANPGVYLWVVEAEFSDGSSKVFKGQTTLLR
ncbi:MAG: proprotein convertase P-domain-containing protein [Bacteroidota bacterium]